MHSQSGVNSLPFIVCLFVCLLVLLCLSKTASSRSKHGITGYTGRVFAYGLIPTSPSTSLILPLFLSVKGSSRTQACMKRWINKYVASWQQRKTVLKESCSNILLKNIQYYPNYTVCPKFKKLLYMKHKHIKHILK